MCDQCTLPTATEDVVNPGFPIRYLLTMLAGTYNI